MSNTSSSDFKTSMPKHILFPMVPVSLLGIDNSLTMQVARNTFAAITLSRGGSLYVVSKALGHASTAVTVAMYGKYLKQSERNEMEKLINLF